MTATNFDNGVCYPIDSIAKSYTMGDVLNHTGGMCGFKYQITNSDPNGYAHYMKVMKDNAQTVLAGSAMALAAVLSF